MFTAQRRAVFTRCTYGHISPYCVLLYCASKILPFFFLIEGMWYCELSDDDLHMIA